MNDSAPPSRAAAPRALVNGFAMARVLPGVILLLVAGSAIRGDSTWWPVAAAAALLALFNLVTGVGLLRLQPWARPAAVVLGVVEMLAFPIGTILSGIVLRYLTRPGVKVLFSRKAVHERTADEERAVAAAHTDSSGRATVVLFAGTGAALFLPLLGLIVFSELWKTSISANEAAILDDLRSVFAAEKAYRQSSGGAYGSLECLVTPQASGCLPAYKGDPFLAAIPMSERKGYRRTFSLAADGKAFTYSAMPQTPRSGIRSFCVDETGRFCARPEPSTTPPVVNGRCNDSYGCSTLE
jgi:hypothetical protein